MTAEPGLTRRVFARRSAALTLAASAPASMLIAPAVAAAQSAESDTVLAGALGLENTLAAVYRAALGSGTLNGEQKRLARAFASQAGVHAQELKQRISDATPLPQAPKPSQVPGLGDLSRADQYLETALGFENQLYLSYLDATSTLGAGSQAALTAQFAASSAEHLALLRRELGRAPANGPFETGAGG